MRVNIKAFLAPCADMYEESDIGDTIPAHFIIYCVGRYYNSEELTRAAVNGNSAETFENLSALCV